MDKYLIDILKEYNTIIIPDLGALTIVNAATNEVMFMPYLKYDDSKLADYIAQREGWEVNEAKNLIAKYVREINSELDKGESYNMYQFGSFSKGDDGDVVFSQWKEDSNDIIAPVIESSQDAIAEEPIIEESTEIETPSESIDEIPTSTVEDTIQQMESNSETIEVEPVEEQKEVVIEDPVNELVNEQTEDTPPTIEEIVEGESQMVSEEEQWNDDLDVPPINYKQEVKKQPILERTEKDKKRKSPVLWIGLALLGVILIGGGAYLGMNYDSLFGKDKEFLTAGTETGESTFEEEMIPEDSEEHTQSEEFIDEKNNSEESAPELTNEDIEETVEQIDNSLEEVMSEEPITITPITGISIDKSLPVQIIVGSFSEESNAQNKVSQLKQAGFNGEIIGRYNGLHFVSIASFNSTKEFRAMKSEIEQISSNYWVFTK